MANQTKGIIFTHIKGTELKNWADVSHLYDERGAFFRSCLRCKNIGLVYIYVSYGIEILASKLQEHPKSPMAMTFHEIENEAMIFDALHLVRDKAIDAIKAKQSAVPKFEFVGLAQLSTLLNKLRLKNPELIENIAGHGNFTYDSPKFVEAVIRIARAHRGDKAPIIRIDGDVEVNESALQQIINAAVALQQNEQFNPYWWFSGSYKGPQGPDDPVNSYAVRQHWLIDPNTWADPKKFRLVPGAETFLRDLGEVGATQVDVKKARSGACDAMVTKRMASASRRSPQVISGAGLVASAEAVRRLPPFMNADEMIVWIDDHLKRQLHEAIGDLTSDDVERILTARLKQDRHPGGIVQKDIQWTQKAYFTRLLGGCLMHATIRTPHGEPGVLAHWALLITNGQLTAFTTTEESECCRQLREVVKTRLAEVIEVWGDSHYGNNILKDWVSLLKAVPDPPICEKITQVGLCYLKLLFNWPNYVFAIENLSPLGAYWLFTRSR
jgi:hypothetical protein